MTTLFSLLISVSLLSVLAESINTHKVMLQGKYFHDSFNYRKNKGSTLLVFVVAMILSLFSGLRTGHNDTRGYILFFENIIPDNLYDIVLIDFSLGDNPGFFIYQVLIKHFISTDPQVFLLVTAFITNILFVFFFYKHSPKFSLTIFIYIASGLFIFGMAGMKQTFAMAIGLWAVHYGLKGKLIPFTLMLLSAATIHPYVIFYGIAPLLKNKLWTWKEFMLLLISLVGVLNFEQFALFIEGSHEFLFEDIEFFMYLETGSNIFRVLVYSIVPVLSFIYRKQLRLMHDTMLTLSVNFSIFSFIFIFIALWGGSILLSRMAIYFSPFLYLAMTYILINCFYKEQRLAVIIVCLISFSIFFYYQYAVTIPFVYRSILGTFY